MCQKFLLSAVLVTTVAAWGCTDTRGASEAFSGACLGEPYEDGISGYCGELFNESGASFCNLHNGCEWTDCDGTCGFCNGTYLGCRSRSDTSGCEGEPGCSWWGPPVCDTWRDCVVLWLENGGCEEVARQPGLVGYGGSDPDESITFADYCP